MNVSKCPAEIRTEYYPKNKSGVLSLEPSCSPYSVWLRRGTSSLEPTCSLIRYDPFSCRPFSLEPTCSLIRYDSLNCVLDHWRAATQDKHKNPLTYRKQYSRLLLQNWNGHSSSPHLIRVIKSRRMRWARHVACVMKGEKYVENIIERAEGKGPFARPRCKWNDNSKMNLTYMGYDRANWINLTWIWSSIGLLYTRWWSLGLHNVPGASCPPELLLPSKGPSSL